MAIYTYICTYCGITFTKNRKAKSDKVAFCSTDCYKTWRLLKSKNNTTNCLLCGKPTKNPKFCSRSCATTFNNKLYPKRTLEGKCVLCNTPIRKDYTYCDSCNPYKIEWSKITLGELQRRRKYQKSSQVREHSRRVYNSSDRPKMCCHCGYTKHYEVCHIKPIADFDDETLITVVNSIDNLIGLCPNCHWEFDNGLLTLPSFKTSPYQHFL